MSVKVEKIVDPIMLGEGPHWDDRQQALFFVGIPEKTIHKYVPASGRHTKTIIDKNVSVSFIIPVEGTLNKFVVGMQRRICIVKWDGEQDTKVSVVKDLGEVDPENPNSFMNDGKADPRGRLFTANLTYVFDLPKNGIEGYADGIAIDADGNLWVAVFLGSCVIKIDPRKGELLQKVTIPAVQVTSCTFGGPDLDALFVTTAGIEFGGQTHPGGDTYVVTGLGVKGLPNVNFKYKL